jgi:hypothetical protein
MEGKHWLLMGLCLVSVGAMGSALPNWSSMLQPDFIFGVLGVIGTQLVTLFTDKPTGGK